MPKQNGRTANDFKYLKFRLNRAGWRAIADLALDLESTQQAVMVEAVNLLLEKHGRAPVAAIPASSSTTTTTTKAGCLLQQLTALTR